MAGLNQTVAAVTARIAARSQARWRRYLDLIDSYDATTPARVGLAEANRAHGFAGCPAQDKEVLELGRWPSIGIVTAHNDMLSAHAPYERFPALIKQAAREAGAAAQVAGGVPAMCDGVTQGFEGMELSLFSRDVIAFSTAVSPSHAAFDAALIVDLPSSSAALPPQEEAPVRITMKRDLSLMVVERRIARNARNVRACALCWQRSRFHR